MSELQSKIIGTINRYSMLSRGPRVGVAVSGGADSVALLYLLLEAAPVLNLQLTVLHVNHCLRGSESEADQQFVQALAASLELPLLTERVDIRAQDGNIEQAARDARRAFFRTAIASGAVDCVATGHTESDQAETVLFRLLRGAYTTGLCGIRPRTAEGVIRPLIAMTRPEVEAYLLDRGIAWREDSSNADPAFARNRIRRHLLPQLIAEWNPNLAEILANHARLAQEDEDFWTAAVATFSSAPPIVIDLASLASEPKALQRRIFREAIQAVRGDLRQIDFRHIEQVMDLAASGEGHGRIQLPGVDVLRSFRLLRFARPQAGPTERNYEFALAVPGVYPIPGGETELVLEVSDKGGEARDTLASVGLDWGLIESRAVSGVERGLELRNWRPGDRYRQAGHDHEEKIKALFHESQVPLWDRRHWPMVCLGDRILWSRRFGAAAEFAVTGTTSSILWISERKQTNY